MGYTGAMEELALSEGLFVDIGGASTEVVRFAHGQLVSAVSCPVGSLKLYRDWVKKILPNQQAVESMKKAIRQGHPGVGGGARPPGSPPGLCGRSRPGGPEAGQTGVPPAGGHNRVSVGQLEQVSALLCSSHKAAADLILKVEPERIHTMIPAC